MSDPCTVLVVDDHADSRDLLVDYLTLSGFTALSAADGAAALERARAGTPRVVLMDLSLPGPLDGWEAIRRLKSDLTTRAAIVIVITGWTNHAAHERALAAGANAVVLKPVDLPGLVERINELCAAPAGATLS